MSASDTEPEPIRRPYAFTTPHSLIDALLSALPVPGVRWSYRKRRQWLRVAEAVFDYVYGEDDG